MNESKTTAVASRVAVVDSRIFVGSGQRRDEEGPAREPEELDDRCQDADRRRDRDDLEPVAGEHLAEQHGERREQNSGQHEAVPDQLQPQSACVESAEDAPTGLRSTAGYSNRRPSRKKNVLNAIGSAISSAAADRSRLKLRAPVTPS